MMKDYFISYSRDIYDEIVQYIYIKLYENNIFTWIDKMEINMGQEIVKNLENTLDIFKNRFGVIVILDNTYFYKQWCLKELNYTLKNNISIYPILYKIKKQDIPREFSCLKNKNIVNIQNINQLDYLITRIKLVHIHNISTMKIKKIRINCKLGYELFYKVKKTSKVLNYIFHASNFSQYVYYKIIEYNGIEEYRYLIFCINQINSIKVKFLKKGYLEEYDYILISKSLEAIIKNCIINY